MGNSARLVAQSGGRDDETGVPGASRCARGGLASRRLSSVERSGGSCLACGGCSNRESSYTGAEGCEEAGEQNKTKGGQSPRQGARQGHQSQGVHHGARRIDGGGG